MNRFKAMNTDFHTFGLPAEFERKAESWFRSIEAQFSRFRSASELSRLNEAAGRPFAASPLLFEVIAEAVSQCRDTGGVFNPFMGTEIAAAGYRDSFELIREHQDAPLPSGDTAGSLADLKNPDALIRLDYDERTIALAPGCRVDLGGIAKGWSAERLAGKLQRQGVSQGAIDAGGDIIVWGAARRMIDVADPFFPDSDLAALRLEAGAGVATSSRLKRRWQGPDGSVRHHILDPRTRKPSLSDLVQVTAVCPTLTQAEVFAKTVLILGSEEGISWLEEQHPDCAVIAVRSDWSLVLGGTAERFLAEIRGDDIHVNMVQ